MYTITKEVYFCYGHRLMEHGGKCRNLHGHSVKASITVAAEVLDRQSMVCDFADVAAVASEFIEAELDHNLILHRDDPLVEMLQEAGERFLTIDEHPTAEVLARRIFQHMQRRGINVVNVSLWETASAYASYSES